MAFWKSWKPWVRRSIVGLIGATVLLGALGACSHQHPYRGGWHAMSDEDAAKLKSRFVERAGKRLDLDEAQKAKLGVVADRLREQAEALAGESKSARADIAALISGATFDRAKARALLDAKTAAVQAKGPDVIAAFGDFYDSLKPEQQTKLREALERRGRRG